MAARNRRPAAQPDAGGVGVAGDRWRHERREIADAVARGPENAASVDLDRDVDGVFAVGELRLTQELDALGRSQQFG